MKTPYQISNSLPRRPSWPICSAENPVIAIAVSDLHLSHEPPRSRKVESDWYRVMRRHLWKLRQAVSFYSVPLLLSGDIFDTPYEPAELVNFVIQNLPEGPIYSVAGQHDLLHHNYADRRKTPYWTLVQAGTLINLEPGEVVQPEKSHLALVGFPWGTKPHGMRHPYAISRVPVALVHRYVWMGPFKYKNAPEDHSVKMLKKQMPEFKTIVCGDNHKGFYSEKGSCKLLNCGAFIPRRSDERNYVPRIGLIRKDGTVKFKLLSTDRDKWLDPKELLEEISTLIDIAPLLGELGKLSKQGVDYLEMLQRAAENKKFSKRTRSLIKEMREALSNA